MHNCIFIHRQTISLHSVSRSVPSNPSIYILYINFCYKVWWPTRNLTHIPLWLHILANFSNTVPLPLYHFLTLSIYLKSGFLSTNSRSSYCIAIRQSFQIQIFHLSIWVFYSINQYIKMSFILSFHNLSIFIYTNSDPRNSF